MTDYFGLSTTDKIDALETAASILGRPADLLEKDIWVVWTLDALFESSVGDHLVFKGGTSLSKAYRAIDRFSEDVDLTYDIRQIIPDLIDNPSDPYPPSRSQARKWSQTVRQQFPLNFFNELFQRLINFREIFFRRLFARMRYNVRIRINIRAVS